MSIHELGASLDDPRRLEAALDELNRRGHRLDRQPDRGVRLGDPIRLDAYLVERGLGAKLIGRSVVCFDRVDSTNDVAMGSASHPGSGGLVVTAESQRMGRGRRGRRWISKSGSGLLFSVLLTDGPDLLDHEAVTIAAGLAVAEGMESAASVRCDLKWPNDVRIDGLKVAGVLIESKWAGDVRATAVGVGVNVSDNPPSDQVAREATCVSAHCRSPGRIELLREILRRLDYWRGEIVADRLDDLREAWIARCSMLNQRVRIFSAGVEHIGRAVDISPLEGLVLACDSGIHVRLPAAVSTVLD